MDLIYETIQLLLTPLIMAADFLAGLLTGGKPATPDAFAVAAFLVTGAAAGIMGSYWAAWMYARLANQRAGYQAEIRRIEAALHFHDLLLQGSEQSIAILEPNQENPFFFGRANRLLHDCMSGGDAGLVAKSLDALLRGGASFDLIARIGSHRSVAIRGLPIGRCAVLFLTERAPNADCNFAVAIDALPNPVWMRGHDKTLRWANRAFFAALGIDAVDDPKLPNTSFIRQERELAASALDSAKPVSTRRFVMLDGKRRTMSLNLVPLYEDGIVGSAIDQTETSLANAKLELAMKARADVMNRLPVAIAIFNDDRRLAEYNAAFARLWSLPKSWLDGSPSYSEILDRLREIRKLPEQRDYVAWKESRLRVFEPEHNISDSYWHLPEGRSLSVKTYPHLEGGILMVLSDVSDHFRAKSDSAMFAQVQQATLEAVGDGMAIFAADGRLLAHNTRFAEIWSLDERDLAKHPHFQTIARRCSARPGADEIWSIVSAAINAVEPEPYSEWARVRQDEGHSIALTMSRLPNGDTAVTFTDLGEIDAFDAALRKKESSHAAI